MSVQEQADRAVRTIELGVIAHRLMIMWLAVVSVTVGIVMILTGAPTFLEDWFSPWSRVVLGMLAFAPAVCTVVGAAIGTHRPCGWWTQLFGLIGQACWYFAMMSAYVGLLMVEGPQWVTLGEPLSPSVSGRGYVPFIYLGLFGLAAIPLLTQLMIGRPLKR